MSLSDEIRAVVGSASSTRAQLRRLVAQVTGRANDAQRLFLDPESGELRPEAVRFFALIAKEAGMERPDFLTDPRLRDYRDGQRALVLFIIQSLRLDVARLEHFQRQLNAMETR